MSHYRPSLTCSILSGLGLCFAAVALGLAGCSSSDSGNGDAKGGTAGSENPAAGDGNTPQAGADGQGGEGNTGPTTPVVGAFNIELKEADPNSGKAAQTAINGAVSDLPTPSPVVWDESVSQGGCQLMLKRIPFCDPECTSDQMCVEDSTCANEPTRQDVGDVTLTGLSRTDSATETALTAVNNNYQLASASALSYPPIPEGSTVTLAASGGDIPAFTIESSGILPLELGGADPLPFESGSSVSLTWNAPVAGSDSRIQIDIDISHHGGQKAKIVCDVADTGSLEIPEPLVTGLIAQGTSGWPTLTIIRVAKGTYELPAGLVELNVMSSIDRPLAIPGIESCQVTADCTTGTCQPDLKCG